MKVGRDMNAATLILASGDSLTAGYALPRAEAFPAQLEARLRKTMPIPSS